MDGYKRIFKNPQTRQYILKMLGFIPDSWMLRLQYRIKLGRSLNLKNPQRYSEKIQWYKLFYRNEKMRICTDKYDVREYVRSKGLSEILNECYGVYDSADEIVWDDLPNRFVAKDTVAGGGRSMVFVYDKENTDVDDTYKAMQSWTSKNFRYKSAGREWVYTNRKHRIIVEKLLIADEDGDLPDYKFFCFDGKVYCLYHMRNYTLHHEEGVLGFLDRDFNLLDAHRADFNQMKKQPDKPDNYNRMVEIAEILSEGFPHVRVDLYNIHGDIVFGELTFFNASGYVQFEPDSFDYELGEQFVLPSKS